MGYDNESYKGIIAYHTASPHEAAVPKRPDKAPASPATASRFADVIKSLRPAYARDFKSFGEMFQHEGRPPTGPWA
jgi:hypothetical protein